MRLPLFAVAALVGCAAVVPRLAPPVNSLDFSLTPAALLAACHAAEVAEDAALARLVAIPAAERDFANTIAALEAADQDYDDALRQLWFLGIVHTDAAVREAATTCEGQSGGYVARRDARRDVYEAVRAYLPGETTLDAEDRRLQDEIVRDFHRNGLDLAAPARERLIGVRKDLATLETSYERNASESAAQVEVTLEDLTGMPADFIARLGRTPAGKLVVTNAYADIFPVLTACRSAATRERVWLMFTQIGGAVNLPLLTNALQLRDEERTLLGYASYVDFVAERNMTGSARVIAELLEHLRRELAPRIRADLEAITALATADLKGGRLAASDQFYYQAEWRRDTHDLDDEALRRYFPADRVMAGMFAVYERVLGVRISEVPAEVWAPGVKLYAVHDADDGRLLARFYVDPYSRPGKFHHEAAFVIAAPQEADGRRRAPLAALVVNFDPPRGGKASGLSFHEIKTLFHELGHVMLSCLARPRYRSHVFLAGDYAEAPAEMFELWPYQPAVLALISVDPDHPGQPIPAAVQERIAASRTFGAGLYWGGQLSYALADYEMHTRPGVDADALLRQKFEEIIGYREHPDEHWGWGFIHAMGGKQAVYYAYLWSAVLAADMYSRFQREGVFGERVGRDYRRAVLEPAGSAPAADLVRDFLGRPANDAAFLEGFRK